MKDVGIYERIVDECKAQAPDFLLNLAFSRKYYLPYTL